MKKLHLIILILLSASFAYSQIQFLPEKEQNFSTWIEFSLAHSTNTGIEKNQCFVSSTYCFNFLPFEGYFSFQDTKSISDLCFYANYLPFVFQKKTGIIRLGLFSQYHLQEYNRIYSESDIIFGGRLYWHSDKNFLFSLNVGFNEKITNLKVLNETINNNDLAVSLEFAKLWPSNTEFFLKVGSHDDFRYPLFLAPRVNIGLAQSFANKFRASASMQLGLTDFFATAFYIDSIAYKFSGRILF